MGKNRNDAATSGTMALLEAILAHSEPLRLTAEDSEAQREAKSLDEKSMETLGIPLRETRKHWTQQAIFRYNGRKNAKRKGIRRNDEEQRVINRAHYAHLRSKRES